MSMHCKCKVYSGKWTYSFLSANQVKLIHNEQVDILDILSLFPPSWQNIPFLRSAHNYIALQVTVSYS